MDANEEFKRWQIAWQDELAVGELRVGVDDTIRLLADHLTPERATRLDEVLRHRSLHVVPVLENIYDRGNVSAVMRSSEAFGFLRMCLVDAPGARFKAANRVSKGAEKWLDTRSYSAASDVVHDLRRDGYQLWATDLDTEHTIDSIDWSRPTAIVLGNEKDGVSAEMRGLVDGRFRIPMLGFAQSFNISVAAALIFYRAHLETRSRDVGLSEQQRRQVLANYYLRCFDNPEALLREKMSR
jgi:tRNA (guanosine-2'-O-)-methyltransferase